MKSITRVAAAIILMISVAGCAGMNSTEQRMLSGGAIGAGAGALLSRFSPRESLQLGIGMVSRGEVGLIVANVGLTAGWLNNEVFSAIITMVLVTTLVTPPLLRHLFERNAICIAVRTRKKHDHLIFQL